jgi:catechol 2,3-dioxygenase-like lactoylglutathione lyase family enzyme
MKATGVAHIAICVRDLEQSLHFYRDLLGMQVKLHTVQPMARRPGAASQAMYETGHEARTVANVWFDDPTTAAPFLVLTSHPGDHVSGQPIKLDQVGISHISFIVDNVKRVAEELIAKGVSIAGDLADFCDAQGNLRTFFVHDPDQILVQFEEAT